MRARARPLSPVPKPFGGELEKRTPRFNSHEALVAHRNREAAAWERAKAAGVPEEGLVPSTFVIPEEWGPPTASWHDLSEVHKLDIECLRWDCPKTGGVLHEVKRLR